jgi:SAM-dependent methyltransferase
MAKWDSKNQTDEAWQDFEIPKGPDQSAWAPRLAAIAARYNQEYQGKAFDLPAEVEAMTLFQDWAAGRLQAQIASPFWELAKPGKNQHCLDLGCGLSFLIYPWREWEANFHGQEISTIARDALISRGPQLNSKLFKGVKLGPAHRLDSYEPEFFDLVIATCVSCYGDRDYWKTVMAAVKPLLKPGGSFVFDAIDPDAELAENWSILETFLGAEVFLTPLSDLEADIKAEGGRILNQRSHSMFKLYKVRFS